ncbi:Copper Transporter integral membrane protein that functions in high affinity copper transport [Aspergillus hancockii]|nr:Copper Transporter integral membrane protein that functions in high affinity copper transport [Aspergillus hancockii]
MDMGTSTTKGIPMGHAATATTSSAPVAPATGKSMSMGGGSSCKISMLWNWYTVDSCFIARSWQITSRGMFAGSCIGVILLVISLEFLRRVGKEYDRFLHRRYQRRHDLLRQGQRETSQGTASGAVGDDNKLFTSCFTPSLLEQAGRAFLHMVQFAVAYLVMLLAMYYNGYIIICIFIGAYLGAFIFSWETFGFGQVVLLL